MIDPLKINLDVSPWPVCVQSAAPTSGFIIDAVSVPPHVERVGLAHGWGETPAKTGTSTRANPHLQTLRYTCYFNGCSTVGIPFPPPLRNRRVKHASRVRYPQYEAEPMQPQHAPSLRSDTHTHAHAYRHTYTHIVRVSTETNTLLHPDVEHQTSEQSTKSGAVKIILSVTGCSNVRKKPCDTFK